MKTSAEKALERWENADEKDRQKILKRVYCTRCMDAVEIAAGWTLAIEGTAPVIRGKCKKCGQKVARVLDIC